jgi:hypothetical protein
MTEQRFDHLWRETLTNHASMVRHANGARTALRLLRRAAYRFTVKILEIQDRYPNEFVAHATSTNKDVEDWMEEHFVRSRAPSEGRHYCQPYGGRLPERC